MRYKILVIEDDRIMRENIAELLELSAYEVETAENGKLGVKKVEEFLPDLIICDVMMPELDGYGVLYILSKNAKTAAIPFIFLTAKSERVDFRKGMTLGADDYLTKPFEEMELLNAVESRLKKLELVKKEFTQDVDGLQEFIKEAEGLNVVSSLTENRKLYSYKANDFIFREGDMANFLFFIQKGKVKSFKLNEAGKEYITEIYQEGDFLGYRPLVELSRYNDFASALEDTEIYKIPKDDFLKLIYNNREVSARFIKMMSKNLSEKENQLLQLAYDSVKRRTALLLKELSEKGSNATIEVSRGDLANMIATSKETLVRTLSGLKEDEIIESDGHSITIINQEKLEQILKWS